MSTIKLQNISIAIGVVMLVIAGSIITLRVLSGSATSRDDFSQTEAKIEGYTLHETIATTVFWAGEDADSSNDFINNRSSAWIADWVTAFGGVDDPSDRCGYNPCGFEPKENTFYFALPMGDYTESGPKSDSELAIVPWFTGNLENDESILKNRWIEVRYGEKTVYAQWQDVGPFNDDDSSYVFGKDRPKESRAGLDVSPAVADYLGLPGRGDTAWHFVEESMVPDGPWKERITRSGTQF